MMSVTNRLRVLHVIPSLSPLRGGPSQVLPLMARGLVDAGIEMHVATTDDNGPGRLKVPRGVPLLQQGFTTWYFERQTRFYTFSWRLTTWLAEHVCRYDLVHIHALFSYPAVAAAFYARRRRVPYIIRPLGTLSRWGMSKRRPWLKHISFRLLEKPILDGAAAIHYTSEQERSEASKLAIRNSGVVLPLGIDVTPFQHLPDREVFLQQYPGLKGKVIVLFLSRLDRKKGLDILLLAFAQVAAIRLDLALLLAGNGEEGFTAELARYAHGLGISNRIIWAGFLDGELKLAALAAADMFVLPSYSENFAVAVVEAMAAGIPVIVSDRVGISAQVEKGGAGIVVRCRADELASAISALSSNSELRQEMGNSGRRLAQDTFSLQATTRNLITLYDSCIDASRSPRVTALASD